jgi:UDP-glucose 4-epimerase
LYETAMQILVTGGAGFIGGHLAEHFVADGHDVVALDLRLSNYDVSLKDHNVEQARAAADAGTGTYEFVEGDVRDESLVAEFVAEADYIYHQAARVGVRDSIDAPQEYESVNVEGTINVLEAAVDHDVERVVLASSSSVYGKPEYLPYDEAHPNAPVSPYGVSKLAQEHYARIYHELHDLSTVVLRYFTVYGPRMRPNMAISNFVSRCLNDKPPVIYGSGKQTRDFTYIEDVVDANETLLRTDAADGEVLNIGSTDNITIQELAEYVRDELLPGTELQYSDGHDADAKHTHADVTKAREILDYKPSRSIREGVSAYAEWYEENRDWYEPLLRRS